MVHYCVIILLCTTFTVGNCSSPILTPAQTRSCICPKSKFELICTVIGTNTDSTIWTGNAIERLCLMDMQQEIILPHREFSENINRTCDGPMDTYAVILQSLDINGSCYTSQLIIESVTRALDDTVVICQLDNRTQVFDIGNYTIILTKGWYNDLYIQVLYAAIIKASSFN